MKPGVYIRDWDEEGVEVGIWNDYYGAIETEFWYYTDNLEAWIYIGEFE